MDTITSRDGTPISYTTRGSGPTVVLVGGGLDDGSENAPLADALAGAFTVVNYARRGRPPSGDTLPYDVRREIEDLEVLPDLRSSGSRCMRSRTPSVPTPSPPGSGT